ncbi:MAG: septum formation initiator family protein [Lactobacillus sp.]|jgi:cell division protein FtsB|nr:septum formation initiator family protein [Lactobacillus sp.]
MGIWFNFKNRLKNSGLLILAVFLFFYFSYFTINGDRGLLRYMYLSKEISQASAIAEQFNSQKSKLEEKVKLLSSSSLDLDLLEERARIVLNFVGDDEFVVLDSTDEV